MRWLKRILVWTASSVVLVLCLVAFALLLMIGTDWGSRRALHLGATLAGYELQVQESRGTLWRGLDITGLRVQGPALALELTELTLAWQPWQLMDNQVQVDNLRLSGLQLRLLPSADDPAASEPLQPEDLEQLLANLPVELHVEALQLDNGVVLLPESEFRLDHLQAAIHLQADAWTIDLQALALYDAEVAGSIALQSNLDIAADLEWLYRMDPLLQGELELAGNLRELAVTHRLQAPLAAQSSGTVVPGLFADNPLSLALQHNLAQLDLAQFGVDDVVLSNLQAETSGNLERLAVSATTDLQALQFAPAAVELALVYSGDAVEIEQLAINSSELSTSLSGNYTIDSSAGQLEWVLDSLTPGPWLEAATLEDLAGSGSATFSHDAAGLDASLQLGPLAGNLNGYPLAINGTVVLEDTQPDSVDLQISNGVNTLAVNGSVAQELALEWDVDITEPENFWQGLSGSLQGSGRLSGEVTAPLLAGNLQGTALALERGSSRYQLDSLQLEAEVTGADNNNLVLQVSDLQLVQDGAEPTTWVESATLNVRGNPASHHLQLEASGFDSELHIALEGARPDSDWQGTLLLAEALSPWGDWELDAPLALGYGAPGFSVAQHCWGMATITVCAAASQAADGSLDGSLELTGLPLAWLNSDAGDSARPEGLRVLQQNWNVLLPPAWQLQGELGLSAEISGFREGSWNELQAEVHLQDTRLRMQTDELLLDGDDETEVLPQSLLLGFTDVSAMVSSDGSTWQAELGLAVEQLADENSDQATLFPRSHVTAVGSMDAADNLQGSINLDFPSLDWLEALIPGVTEPRGRVSGNVRIAGTREAPSFDAGLNLVEGSFRVPELGLEVQELQAELQGTPEQASLQLSARDAQGSLSLQAQMENPLDDTRSLSASLVGEDFILMDNEAARVDISPDLELAWSAAALQVNGSLLVPRADIALDAWVGGAGSGALSPSHDAVVVVEDPEARVADSGNALPFTASLRIALGEEVYVRGLGLDARLAGELELQQQLDRPLLAYGELMIPEGSYEIYNQELQTRDGRLMFYGNPLDPVLDLRAFRETPNAEVGMQLSGNVSTLQSTLYSTPEMPENEILALLVTGKSFNSMDEGDGNALASAVANFGIERSTGLTSAIGDTLGLDSVSISGGDSYLDSSLGMGKYLTPDLLMRYEIGLFGRAATLSLVYTLTEHLKLEVRSGLSQSIDISYSIEKN